MHVTALCPGLTKTEFQQRSNTQSYSSTYPDFVWTSAESVAATGLADVAKNRTLAVPGALYKGMVGAASITPRFITRRMSGLVGRA